MSMVEIKNSISELTVEERREVADLIARLNHANDSENYVQRPEGYFASDYPLPEDRRELEAAMAQTKQHPDR
jgi:hypothetical protein